MTRFGLAVCRSQDAAAIDAYFGRSLPPIDRQLRNVTGSLARWIAAGSPVVCESVRLSRLAQCLTCPRYDQDRDRCRECGCGVKKGVGPIPQKVTMATEFCPLGKWSVVTDRLLLEPTEAESARTTE